MSLQANNHNPSIITPEWMKSKELLPEKINTHETKINNREFKTKNYLFLVCYEQVIVKVTKHQQLLDIYLDGLEHSEVGDNCLITNIPDIFIKYIEILPEVPYRGIDIVHDFNVYSADVELEDLFSLDYDMFTGIGKDLKLGGFLQFDFLGYDAFVRFAPYKKDINVRFEYSFQSDDIEILRKKIKKHYATMNFARDLLSTKFRRLSDEYNDKEEEWNDWE